MSTGQTILTIGAFVLLTTILQGLYNSLANIGGDISSGQDGILSTTIATSYCEFANRLAFDQITDTSDVALTSPLTLSYPLGPEAGEDSLSDFNDFDDLNGYSEVKVAGGSGRAYRTTFRVTYVDELNINSYLPNRTYLKRLDMKTWRISPPPLREEILDTLSTSLIMGYFHFD